MSVAIKVHVGVGFCRAQTTLTVQVPLEEWARASKVDVRVQTEGDLISRKCVSDLHVMRRRLRECCVRCYRGHLLLQCDVVKDVCNATTSS
jgi:hypothetical protein